MTRIAGVVVPGVAHHISQRGNNRQVFVAGLPATDRFISKLESKLGPRLRPLPGGRRRKQ